MPTGIEEAGLALAVASITFEIFAGCVKGFQLLSRAHHLGKDAELLVCILWLEEYRLMLWAEKSGLIDDNLDRRLNEEVIKTTLSELRSLLNDTEKLKKRYKLDVRDGDIPKDAVAPAGPSAEALRFLDNEMIVKEQGRILRRAKFEQKENAFPKRLWWAAMDRKGFEKLIEHIATLVQRLFDFLSIAAQEDTQQSLHLVQLSLLSIVERLDDMKLVTERVQRAVVPDETLTTVAALRALQIDLSNPSASQELRPAPMANKRLLQSIKDLEPARIGAIALYEGVPVYVERKRYTGSNVSGANAVTISIRVQSLSRLLNIPKAPSFRSLHCIGYFQDSLNSEYDFVFDRPLNSRENIPPRSLLSLLKSSYIPSQTQRLRLATELATTLLHLHAGGWLHKGLRSDNILFFPASSDAPRTLDEPYIMGYEYARHDKPGELSEKPSQNPAHDVYRHPRAQGPVSDNYKKAFDIYSLGIILVEIAQWRAIADIIEKMGLKLKDVSSKKMQEVRERISNEEGLDIYPQNLRFRMGDEYTKVVLCCLGTVFEDETRTRQDSITTFYDLVVRRLQSCKV
ncbi:hypothetical protein H2199_001488 [Coniosporium tulheliwenetii]|uniref:Uncharacterized protein n=1 Tax=Coniosporium tulheliwenetii TaxID=3383036 RepID=A0ACC2ZM33_9PEZI|nr:hypothetical protein H2199_001488 [Cladosporium sp. JES 115]